MFAITTIRSWLGSLLLGKQATLAGWLGAGLCEEVGGGHVINYCVLCHIEPKEKGKELCATLW